MLLSLCERWLRPLGVFPRGFSGVRVLVCAPNAESGVGFAISLLSLVLGGTVGLGIAVHKTDHERTEYALYYALAGLPVLGAMTSILRASNLGACETCKAVYRGAGERAQHHFDHVTICFTRWALASSLILCAFSAVRADDGTFPGQQRRPRTELPVADVVGYKYEVAKEYKDRPGLIAQFSIGRKAYPDGVPRRSILAVALSSALEKDWEFARRCDLLRRPSPSQDYETVYPGAFLIQTEWRDSERVEVRDLEQDGDYRLDIYLVGKRTAAKREEATEQQNTAIKLIKNENKLPVIDVTDDWLP